MQEDTYCLAGGANFEGICSREKMLLEHEFFCHIKSLKITGKSCKIQFSQKALKKRAVCSR